MLFTVRLIPSVFCVGKQTCSKNQTMHLQPTLHYKRQKKITQFVQMLRQGLSVQVLSDISRGACTT